MSMADDFDLSGPSAMLRASPGVRPHACLLGVIITADGSSHEPSH
jgi:hypothetical protein